MKVLVVDDDWAVADVISLTLRRASYEVIVAHDGQQALEFWSRESPDLIILDLNLPIQNGFNVLKHIRLAGNTPVIILSVRDGQEDINLCRQAGANDYFTKPFSPRQLLARVQALIQPTSAKKNTQMDQVARHPLIKTKHI